MEEVQKKWKFAVYYFNEKTKEVDLTATMTTAKITKTRLHELARIEMSKAKQPCCYRVLTPDF